MLKLTIKNIKNKKRKNKKRKSKKNKIIIVEKKYTDDEISDLEGNFFNLKSFKYKINYNCDVYYYNDKKKILLAKFRKNEIPKKLYDLSFNNLESAAKREHDNRGSAGGLLDLKKLPKWVNPNKIIDKQKYIIGGYISNITNNIVRQNIGNVVKSNIIGYYDKPDRNIKSKIPCRLTQFNKLHNNKFKNALPLIKKINSLFKNLTPKKYKKQYKQANKTKFVIDKTAFSTITLNYNWRTALHKDSGDYMDGFGNLIVCDDDNYEGGYTGFPQFDICFNVRSGDFLAMDVHEWHCNTEIKKMKKNYKRLSIVCYLRNNMIKCK